MIRSAGRGDTDLSMQLNVPSGTNDDENTFSSQRGLIRRPVPYTITCALRYVILPLQRAAVLMIAGISGGHDWSIVIYCYQISCVMSLDLKN